MRSRARPRPTLSHLLFAAALGASIAVLADPARSIVAPEAAGQDYAAAFVSQEVPSVIELFALTPVSVTMRNTGTATWFSADGDVFLATQEPQDNYYWCIQDNPHGMYSGNRVLLPHDVAPGETVTFDFVVKPLGCRFAATAPFRFRMLSQLHGTFGEESPDPGIVVSTASEFVAQQVPDTIPTGASVRVSVSFKNTTQTKWSAGDGYELMSASPAGNTTWGFASVPLGADVAPGETTTFTFQIDVPKSPGTYGFQWQMNSTGRVPFGQTSPPTPIDVVAAGPPNYGGLWWAKPAGSESGWGINLAHQGDIIFATWFTYDAAGRALWLTVTAEKTPSGTYTGRLIQTTGPAFDIVPFRPDQVRAVDVGSGTFSFVATDSPFDVKDGTFDYTLNGVMRTKSITRQVFAQLPSCTFGLLTDLTPAYNYQDLWWAAPADSEPGWGVYVTQQEDVIFATWFTYDHDNAPLWLSFTAQKAADADATYTGTLYRTTGPPFDSNPFDPSQVVGTSVGTASLVFSNGNAGTFSWSVDDVTGSTSITRQIFQPPGTVCQ